jgi:murein DD-endopeptidase MepM/ murein hydrolase activator NlpD
VQGRNLVGDALRVQNALGYGAPVKAAAAGEVVFVIVDDVQDRAAFMPRPGEDRNSAGQRIGAFNMQRFAKDFRRAAAGNIVTLKHQTNGAVEYTSYGHLKSGSVKLRVGDRVAQGQVIGAVGDTGDSPVVHLHFQVNAGPDAFMSKSLPAVFIDLKYPGASRDPGRFVTNGR